MTVTVLLTKDNSWKKGVEGNDDGLQDDDDDDGVQDDDDIDGVQELYEKRSLLIMGRGYNYATCLEGALKVAIIIIMLGI